MCYTHMLPTLRASNLHNPRLNIRRITIRTPIQETRYNILIVSKHSTMKFNWDFDQGFTSQTMSCVDRRNWCFVWSIPNICGISTGNAYILGSSTQVEPPDYELNLLEISRYDHSSKRKPPGTEIPEGLGGFNIKRQRREDIILTQ